MEDLLPEFLAETLESLELVGAELVKLERQPAWCMCGHRVIAAGA